MHPDGQTLDNVFPAHFCPSNHLWTCSWPLAVLKDELKHLKIFESLSKN